MDMVDWTAALVTQLDVVIHVHTFVGRLAGRPARLPNRSDADWRWFPDRERTVWHPAHRQSGQTTSEDWTGLIDTVRTH